MSDQPDASHYRVAGQPADRRSADRPAVRSDRKYANSEYANSEYANPEYASPEYPRRADQNYPNPEYSRRVDRNYPEQNHAGQPFYRGLPSDQADGARRSRNSRARPERGLPGWLALLVLIGIAGASGLIDSLSGSSVRGVFNYGLVVASLVAILVVKRSGMFPVVVAPPLVYFVASAALLYIRTGGLHNRGALIDAATNWIVYGFPAIAGATAVVLVIAGIRLVTRR